MTYNELKNSEINRTDNNEDITKMDYTVLFRIYKIVRDLLKIELSQAYLNIEI